MDSIEVSTRLTSILEELNTLENDKLLLWATIYTRKCEQLKNKKVDDFRSYLNGQVKLYNKNLRISQYIDDLVSKYDLKISRIIEQYNAYYVYLQNEIILAQSNQKIAIANIMSSRKKLDKANDMQNVILIEKANKKIFATAQKKLNYDVVIDEITTRLEKCMKDTYDTINSIFNLENNKMTVANNKMGFLEKLKAFFHINFNGSKKFNKYFLLPLNNKFNELELQTISSISKVKTDMLIFVSQIEKVRKDINLVFNEVLNQA